MGWRHEAEGTESSDSYLKPKLSTCLICRLCCPGHMTHNLSLILVKQVLGTRWLQTVNCTHGWHGYGVTGPHCSLLPAHPSC